MTATLQHRRQSPEPTPTETLARDATACPECAAALVDGQGLVACTDCEWTGIYA